MTRRTAASRSGVAALAMLVSPCALADIVYSNDFQGLVGPEWSSNKVVDVTGSGRRVLGNFSNEAVTLSLSGLTPGTLYTLSFDFFALGSWDGTGAFYSGPDLFTVSAGDTSLLNATFSVLNETGARQTYAPDRPLAGPLGGDILFDAYTGADERDTLTLPQFNWYGNGNAVWKFDGSGQNAALPFVPSAASVTFSFAASGLQTEYDSYYGLDESWGIDNVVVSQAVPEPTTLAALGLGALAVLRRKARRR